MVHHLESTHTLYTLIIHAQYGMYQSRGFRFELSAVRLAMTILNTCHVTSPDEFEIRYGVRRIDTLSEEGREPQGPSETVGLPYSRGPSDNP